VVDVKTRVVCTHFYCQSFRDESGQFIEDIVIDKTELNSDILKERGSSSIVSQISFGTNKYQRVIAYEQQVPILKRYQEKPGFAVRSGHDIGIGNQRVDSNSVEAEGVLDVDMAEMSLGQRLTVAALNPVEASGIHGVDKSVQDRDSIPISSLARTLTQALHSSDSRLLELCLAHSEPVTIQNTVERLSPQFALPLINACIERLGRGHRGANLKGGGGGASSQRGMVLVAWVRSVLIIHSGHLMAVSFEI
jgi:Dip2/Utp12 Family